MHEKILMDWLKEKNLTVALKNHSKYFQHAFNNSFNLKKDQEILIISDWGSYGKRVALMVASCWYVVAKKLGYNASIVIQTPKKGNELANKEVIESLYKLKQGNVVIMSLSNKPGSFAPVIGKSFRRFALQRKYNFISTTGLGDLENKDFYIITRALNINYKEMKKNGARIKKILDKGRKIQIKTDAGTDFTADITGMKSISIDGDYTGASRGGNLPAGEVYLPPITGSVNGEIIIDGSSRNDKGTSIIETPIKLKIKQSQVVKIEGNREAKLLGDTLKKARKKAKLVSNITKIGEIGIGLNPYVDIIGSMVVDEKAVNSAHIAIGSNYWFGGDIFTFLHLDQVMRRPKIFVDGKKLEI